MFYLKNQATKTKKTAFFLCNQKDTGKTGLAPLFLNREGNIKYARIRHYAHIDTATHKPQFTYCKIEDIESLKTLLKTQAISLTTEKVERSQIGHEKEVT
jgi:hypothetical protein